MQDWLNEFLGTAFLAFCVIITSGNFLAAGAGLGLAVLWGGGHYNPAVTLTLATMVGGYKEKKDLIPILLAQIAGALCAFEIVKRLL